MELTQLVQCPINMMRVLSKPMTESYGHLGLHQSEKVVIELSARSDGAASRQHSRSVYADPPDNASTFGVSRHQNHGGFGVERVGVDDVQHFLWEAQKVWRHDDPGSGGDQGSWLDVAWAGLTRARN